MSGKTHAPPDLKKYVHLCVCLCVLACGFVLSVLLCFVFLCLKSFVRLWCGVVRCGVVRTCYVLLRVLFLFLGLKTKNGNVGCVKLEDVVMTEPMPVSGGEPLATA